MNSTPAIPSAGISCQTSTDPHDGAAIQDKTNNFGLRARACNILNQTLYEAPTTIYLIKSFCPTILPLQDQGWSCLTTPSQPPRHNALWIGAIWDFGQEIVSLFSHPGGPHEILFCFVSPSFLIRCCPASLPFFFFIFRLQSHWDKMWAKTCDLSTSLCRNHNGSTIFLLGALLPTFLFAKEVKKDSQFLSQLKRLFSPL